MSHQLAQSCGMVASTKPFCPFLSLGLTLHLLPVRFSDTMDGKGPKLGDNAFTIKEILSKAGTTYDEIKADGCVVAVKLKWSCPMASKKCPHELDVKRLDPKDDPVAKGFNFKQAFKKYFRAPGVFLNSLPTPFTLSTHLRSLMMGMYL